MEKDVKYSISQYFQEKEKEGCKFVSSNARPKRNIFSRVAKIVTSLSLAGLVLVGCGAKTDQAEISDQGQKIAEFEKTNFNNDYTLIEIWKTVENSKGYIFYDPRAEYEPDIFVSKTDGIKWNLQDVEIGQKVVGVFDKDGWELLDVMKVEN